MIFAAMTDFQKYSTNQVDFFANRIIYTWTNCRIRSNTAKVWKIFKLELDDLRNKGKKNNLRWHFGKLYDRLINKIKSEYRYCIIRIYALCNYSSFLKVWYEKIVKSEYVQVLYIDLRPGRAVKIGNAPL